MIPYQGGCVVDSELVIFRCSCVCHFMLFRFTVIFGLWVVVIFINCQIFFLWVFIFIHVILTHASCFGAPNRTFQGGLRGPPHGLGTTCLTSYIPQIDVEMSHLYLEETSFLPYIYSKGLHSYKIKSDYAYAT